MSSLYLDVVVLDDEETISRRLRQMMDASLLSAEMILTLLQVMAH
jgi:hypothetical protein